MHYLESSIFVFVLFILGQSIFCMESEHVEKKCIKKNLEVIKQGSDRRNKHNTAVAHGKVKKRRRQTEWHLKRQQNLAKGKQKLVPIKRLQRSVRRSEPELEICLGKMLKMMPNHLYNEGVNLNDKNNEIEVFAELIQAKWDDLKKNIFLSSLNLFPQEAEKNPKEEHQEKEYINIAEAMKFTMFTRKWKEQFVWLADATNILVKVSGELDGIDLKKLANQLAEKFYETKGKDLIGKLEVGEELEENDEEAHKNALSKHPQYTQNSITPSTNPQINERSKRAAEREKSKNGTKMVLMERTQKKHLNSNTSSTHDGFLKAFAVTILLLFGGAVPVNGINSQTTLINIDEKGEQQTSMELHKLVGRRMLAAGQTRQRQTSTKEKKLLGINIDETARTPEKKSIQFNRKMSNENFVQQFDRRMFLEKLGIVLITYAVMIVTGYIILGGKV